jgi:hypothetical protein
VDWRRSCAGSAKHCIWTGRPRPVDVVTFLTSFAETHPLYRHRSGDVYYFGPPTVCPGNAELYKVPPVPILDPLARTETASVAVEPSRFTRIPYSSGSNSLYEHEPTMVPRDGTRSVADADEIPAFTIQSLRDELVVLTHDHDSLAQTSLNEANAGLSELEHWLREFLPMLVNHRRENGPVAVNQTGNDTLVIPSTDSSQRVEESYSTASSAVPSSVVTASSRKRKRSIDAPDPESRGKHRR